MRIRTARDRDGRVSLTILVAWIAFILAIALVAYFFPDQVRQ